MQTVHYNDRTYVPQSFSMYFRRKIFISKTDLQHYYCIIVRDTNTFLTLKKFNFRGSFKDFIHIMLL